MSGIETAGLEQRGSTGVRARVVIEERERRGYAEDRAGDGEEPTELTLVPDPRAATGGRSAYPVWVRSTPRSSAMLCRVRSPHRWIGLLALAACGEAHVPTEAGPDSCDTGETLTFEVYLTGYARADAEGRVPGMNLDGRVSEVTDEESCHQVDFVGADGEEGVDNQWGTVVYELESDPYLIETGPIALVLGGVDDSLDDECITFQLNNGTPIETKLINVHRARRTSLAAAPGTDGT